VEISELIRAQEGARRIIEASATPNQTMAIIGSTDVDFRYYEILMAIAESSDVVPVLGVMTPRTTYGKPAPKAVETLGCAADVVLMSPSTSLAHTSTALNILKAGKRPISFPVPPGSGHAIQVLGDQAIYDLEKLTAIKELCVSCARILDSGTEVRVKSPAGTELNVSIEGRTTHSWYGLLEEYGHFASAWPPGDAHISTIEDSANGTAVIDGYVGGLGIPDQPLILTFENGRLTHIKGKDSFKLERILAASDDNARIFAEAGLGTNPWQRPVNSNGDKYTVGTFHLAIGANATPCFGGVNFDGKNRSDLHLDCLMLAPVEVWVDDIKIVGEGRILV